MSTLLNILDIDPRVSPPKNTASDIAASWRRLNQQDQGFCVLKNLVTSRNPPMRFDEDESTMIK